VVYRNKHVLPSALKFYELEGSFFGDIWGTFLFCLCLLFPHLHLLGTFFIFWILPFFSFGDLLGTFLIFWIFWGHSSSFGYSPFGRWTLLIFWRYTIFEICIHQKFVRHASSFRMPLMSIYFSENLLLISYDMRARRLGQCDF